MPTEQPTASSAEQCVDAIEDLRQIHSAYQEWRDADERHTAASPDETATQSEIIKHAEDGKSNVNMLIQLYKKLTDKRLVVRQLLEPLMDFAAADGIGFGGLRAFVVDFDKDVYLRNEYLNANQDLDLIRRRLKAVRPMAVKEMTVEKAVKLLAAYKSHNSFSSLTKLAKLLKCSRHTVTAAIRSSPALTAWQKRGNLKIPDSASLATTPIHNNVPDRESNAEDKQIEEDDARELRLLIEEFPQARDWVNKMSPKEKKQFQNLTTDDKRVRLERWATGAEIQSIEDDQIKRPRKRLSE